MASPTQPDPSPLLSHVQSVCTTQKSNSPIYALLLNDITITSAVEGTITATLPISSTHTNSKGGLHGTLTACLVDWAAGMAIASYGGTYTGISTDIHISYQSSAKEGDVLQVEGRVTKMGGTLAFVAVEISKDGGEGKGRVVVATGLHTKYVKQRG
ncbi:thioesterase family protein [Aspergillus karnatakaensis]|uniref:PaaI family thioesterase n=1 Tax=Aspergillus karnatakaensis TaxID=1810916 RepID=UPI003CCDFFA5